MKEKFKRAIIKALNLGEYLTSSGVIEETSKDKKVDFETAIRNIAYSMINIRARTFSNIPTIVNIGDKEAPETNFAKMIVDKPNKFYNWVQLKYMLQYWLDIDGNAYLHTPIINNQRSPKNAYVLPSTKIKIIADKENFEISGYEYKINSTKKVFIPEKEICHFKTMFPSNDTNTLLKNMFYGQPHLLTASAYAINTDKAVAKYILKNFKRDAVAPFILNTKENVTPTEWERRKEAWIKSFKDYPLKGIMRGGESIEQLPTGSANIINSMSANVDDYILLIMCSIWGVPKSKILSKYENKDTAQVNENVFRTETIEPLLNSFDEVLTNHFKQFDSRISIKHNPYTYVDAKTRVMENSFYLKNGIKSRNEIRAEIGLEPIPDGDEYLISNSLVKYDELGVQMPMKSIIKGIKSDKKLEYWKAFDDKIEKNKGKIKKIVVEIYDYILKDITKTKSKSKRGIRFDLKNYLKLVDAKLTPPAKKMIETQMKQALAEVDIDFVRADYQNEIERILLTSKDKVGDSIKTIEKEIKDIDVVESYKEIETKFKDVYMKSRAETVSATTVTHLLNSSTTKAWEKNDIEMTWLSMRDDKVRDAHRQADGQERINGYFEVGGEKLPFPAGGSIPENNINCRCTVFPK